MFFDSFSIRDKLFTIILPVVLFSVGTTLMLNILFMQRAQKRIALEETRMSENQINLDLEIRNMALSALLISGGGGILLYVVLFVALEKTMIKPVEGLLESARQISKDKDFQIRVARESEDEIGQLVSTFNEMTEELDKYYQELEASNQELAHFAHVASHDLQEPLRMVGCFVERLAERYHGQIDEQADQYINFAVEGATRMQKMIQGLLEYSKLQSNTFSPTAIDSGEALADAIANLNRKIKETNARIEYDPKTLPKVQFESPQLIRLWQNLIANAIHFHDSNTPVVKINAAEEGNEVVFTVADNGIGIDPFHQEMIFGLFQQLNPPDLNAGTGIGLAVCKRIIERQGGRIWLQSKLGEGATFCFSISKGVNDNGENS